MRGGYPSYGATGGANVGAVFPQLAERCEAVLALVPGGMMPTTELGKVAVEAYASSLGILPADFLKNMRAAPTIEDVARAVVECASDPQERAGKAFLVSSVGVKLVS